MLCVFACGVFMFVSVLLFLHVLVFRLVMGVFVCLACVLVIVLVIGLCVGLLVFCWPLLLLPCRA